MWQYFWEFSNGKEIRLKRISRMLVVVCWAPMEIA
jgi:hypothetical protein